MPIELRKNCERLIAIVQAPPEDDYCHPFGSGDIAPDPDAQQSIHRCLSQAEVRAKLRAIERLTGRSVVALFEGDWEQLSPTQLLAVENVVQNLEAGERTQPLGGQAPAWCRLDEQLFRLAFTAWIKGNNFAATFRPRVLAQQIGLDLAGYRKALQRLRAALTRPSAPSPRWPPRVDLWLGEPPTHEAGPSMPRLWVSARVLKLGVADATKAGLLPANTIAQEELAREELGRRWSSRGDEADPSGAERAPQQYTICCRCSRILAV